MVTSLPPPLHSQKSHIAPIASFSVCSTESMVNVFPNLASVLYPLLTLTALSLFYKLLPISNTGDSIAYILATVHFLYPKLGSFSDMEHYFYQLAYRYSKVPKRFVECSALPLLTGTGANKMTPLHVGTSYIHDFRFHSKGNASGTHQSTWAGSLKPQFAWAARGLRPL